MRKGIEVENGSCMLGITSELLSAGNSSLLR